MKEPKILIYRFLERYDGTSPEPIDSYTRVNSAGMFQQLAI